MEVLFYLLADRLCESPGIGQHGTTRILLGSRKTEAGDEEHLWLFSAILLDVERAHTEETFNALHKSLPCRWNDDEPYDTVNPFGNRRQIQYCSLWTFDTREDFLYHTNRHQCSRVPLSLLRARVVTMADMEVLGPPVPTPLSLEPDSDPEIPYWKPQVEIDDRLRAFTHRLLRDFHYKRRHILRNRFNFTTLRILARAIIRISTLDFEIHENTGGHGPRGVHVWIMQLPQWEPLRTEIECTGNVHVVLCQEMQEGLLTAKRHLASRKFGIKKNQIAADNAEPQANYLVLSVKHIMLCHAINPTSLANTAPEPLFNGDYGSGFPSDLALDYLVWATASARPLIVTPLQLLPVEIQEMLLSYVSVGTVEAAKLGCLLGLGSPFSWRHGTRENTLEE